MSGRARSRTVGSSKASKPGKGKKEKNRRRRSLADFGHFSTPALLLREISPTQNLLYVNLLEARNLTGNNPLASFHVETASLNSALDVTEGLEQKKNAISTSRACETVFTKTSYRNHSSPKWNEEAVVPLPSASAFLVVRVFEELLFKSANRLIGTVRIPLAEYSTNELHQFWLQLRKPTKKPGSGLAAISPAIQVRFMFRMAGATIPSAPSSAPAKATSAQRALQYSDSEEDTPRQCLQALLRREDCRIGKLILCHLQRSRAKADQVIKALLCAYQHQTFRQTMELLTFAVEDEVGRTADVGSLFRHNDVAPRLLSAFAQSVGREFVQSSLKAFVLTVLNTLKSCEIDPHKLKGSSTATVDKHVRRLTNHSQRLLASLDFAFRFHYPLALRTATAVVAAAARRALERKRQPKGGVSEASSKEGRNEGTEIDAGVHNVIVSFVFLRFLLPALLFPSKQGVLDASKQPPAVHPTATRTLVLLGKLLQRMLTAACPSHSNLEGVSRQDGKEPHMAQLGGLVTASLPTVRSCLELAQRIEPGEPRPGFPLSLLEKNSAYEESLSTLQDYLRDHGDELLDMDIQMQRPRSDIADPSLAPAFPVDFSLDATTFAQESTPSVKSTPPRDFRWLLEEITRASQSQGRSSPEPSSSLPCPSPIAQGRVRAATASAASPTRRRPSLPAAAPLPEEQSLSAAATAFSGSTQLEKSFLSGAVSSSGSHMAPNFLNKISNRLRASSAFDLSSSPASPPLSVLGDGEEGKEQTVAANRVLRRQKGELEDKVAALEQMVALLREENKQLRLLHSSQPNTRAFGPASSEANSNSAAIPTELMEEEPREVSLALATPLTFADAASKAASLAAAMDDLLASEAEPSKCSPHTASSSSSSSSSSSLSSSSSSASYASLSASPFASPSSSHACAMPVPMGSSPRSRSILSYQQSKAVVSPLSPIQRHDKSKSKSINNRTPLAQLYRALSSGDAGIGKNIQKKSDERIKSGAFLGSPL